MQQVQQLRLLMLRQRTIPLTMIRSLLNRSRTRVQMWHLTALHLMTVMASLQPG